MAWYYWAGAAMLVFVALLAEAKGKAKRGTSAYFGRLAGDDAYDFEIVGESKYQHNIANIAGAHPDGVEHYCNAVLEHEPHNTHDGNAVCVTISGLVVGYVRRSEAPFVADFIGRGCMAGCRAVIVGGWDHGPFDQGYYGVKLDIAWPLRRE